MKNYITKFANISTYNNAELDYPNVSLITSDKSIKYVKMKPIPNNQFTYYSTTKVVELTDPNSTSPGFHPDGIMNKYSKWSANMTSHTFENGIGIITFDGDITSIPAHNGFGGESNLTAIILPGTITSIGNLVFYNCTSLNSITIPAMTAPTIDSELFRYVPSGGTLYVTTGATGYDNWMSKLNNWTISYL